MRALLYCQEFHKTIETIDEDLAGVQWVDEPPNRQATVIQCFISPPASYTGVAKAIPADCLLMVMPFADGRWFVARRAVRLIDQHELANVREQTREIGKKNGFKITTDQRAIGFIDGESSARGLVEYCLVGWHFFSTASERHT